MVGRGEWTEEAWGVTAPLLPSSGGRRGGSAARTNEWKRPTYSVTQCRWFESAREGDATSWTHLIH